MLIFNPADNSSSSAGNCLFMLSLFSEIYGMNYSLMTMRLEGMKAARMTTNRATSSPII